MTTTFTSAVSQIRAVAQQQGPSVSSDGQLRDLTGDRLGSLFTAGWKERLILGGYGYTVSVGSVSAGGDVALVTGGGAGTTIDSDQPELIVSVGTGYFLVPLGFHAAAQVDLDADAEVGNILLFADITQAVAATGVTGTAATVVPMIDGGAASVAYGWHTVTGDVTDPVASLVLGYATVRNADNGTAGNSVDVSLRLDYDPSYPRFLAGPCSIVACWGGTAAVTASAILDFAVLPAAAVA